MQIDGSIFIVPKNRDSRQESMCIHYKWEQESKLGVFSVDSCSVYVHPEEVIIILERLHHFAGVPIGVKNGETYVRIKGVNIIVATIGSPGHVKETPSLPFFCSSRCRRNADQIL